MATVLQHQIAGRVNDLNQKMMTHARIIFQLSVELDKTKSENEELKKILLGHKIAIKQLKSDFSEKTYVNKNDSEKEGSVSLSDDITITKDLKNSYDNFVENDSQSSKEPTEFYGENNSSVTLNMLK